MKEHLAHVKGHAGFTFYFSCGMRGEGRQPCHLDYIVEVVHFLQDVFHNENETSEIKSGAKQLYNRMLT